VKNIEESVRCKTRKCILFGVWRETAWFSNTPWFSKLVFLVDVTEKKLTIWMRHCKQCCGVDVARSRGFWVESDS